MGWSYCQDHKEPLDVIREALAPDAWTDYQAISAHLVMTAPDAGQCWAIMADKLNPEDRSRRWILLILLERSQAGEVYPEACWGSKLMEEAVGPYYHDVPLEYLEEVPPPQGPGYGDEWRRRVRQYHATPDRKPKARPLRLNFDALNDIEISAEARNA